MPYFQVTIFFLHCIVHPSYFEDYRTAEKVEQTNLSIYQGPAGAIHRVFSNCIHTCTEYSGEARLIHTTLQHQTFVRRLFGMRGTRTHDALDHTIFTDGRSYRLIHTASSKQLIVIGINTDDSEFMLINLLIIYAQYAIYIQDLRASFLRRASAIAHLKIN